VYGVGSENFFLLPFLVCGTRAESQFALFDKKKRKREKQRKKKRGRERGKNLFLKSFTFEAISCLIIRKIIDL